MARIPFRAFVFALPVAGTLLLAAPALAAGVPPSQASAQQRDEATKHFTKGREQFAANKLQDALAAFTASYDVVASPNTRLYIARCKRDLNQLRAAYTEFQQTADEANALAREDAKYAKTAQSALDERKAIEDKLAFVTLSVANASNSTVVKVAGDVLPKDAWTQEFPVAPGMVDVVVESPGRPPVTQNLQIAAGEHKSASLDAGVEPPPVQARVDVPTVARRPFPLRTLAYVAGGVAAAGFVTFTVAGLMANGTYSDLESACGSTPCPPGWKDDIDAGRTQQTIANVGLVVGVVGAATAVTLFVVSKKKNPAPAASAITARVTANPGFVGLQGAF